MQFTQIPTRSVGPMRVNGIGDVCVPMATFEKPLWPSVNRGAKISILCGGITSIVDHDFMTRSFVLEAECAATALHVKSELKDYDFSALAQASSRFAQFEHMQIFLCGNLLYFRLAIQTGEAAGHNMVTKLADEIIVWILERYPLTYVSISGNMCTDKKVSAINGILGRGKYVIADIVVDRATCLQYLRTTPEGLVALNTKKNLLGSILAGSVRSANAHFANILLACYLASGQDAANIVEGSQGIVHTDMRGQDLYFSVTIPNMIVSSLNRSTTDATQLARIFGATVLCGELSLLAAQANQGELMRAHLTLERQTQHESRH